MKARTARLLASLLIAATSAAGCTDDPADAFEDERAGDAESELAGGGHGEANIGVFRSRLHDVTEVAGIFVKDAEACSRRVRIPRTTCTIQRCPGDRTNPEAFVDAGVLSVTSGARSLVVTDVGGFFFLGQLEPGFEAGDRITVAATGSPDGAPAFSTRVTVPASMELLAPTFTGNDDPFTVSRARDLVVRWSGEVTSVGGNVVVNMNDNTTLIGGEDLADAGRTTLLECTFDGRAGHGRVPARVLANLRTGEGGSIFIHSVSERTTFVRGWRIAASASSDQQARPLVVH